MVTVIGNHALIPNSFSRGFARLRLTSITGHFGFVVRRKKSAPNIWKIPEDIHKAIHSGPAGGRYNARFKEELRKLEQQGRAITKEDVLRIRDDLVKEFDLERYRPGGEQ